MGKKRERILNSFTANVSALETDKEVCFTEFVFKFVKRNSGTQGLFLNTDNILQHRSCT